MVPTQLSFISIACGNSELEDHHMVQKTQIPYGDQFSPSQVDLPKLLEIIHRHGGDRHSMLAAILDTFFSSHAADSDNPEEQRHKLAGNAVLSMVQYGLLEQDSCLPTELASELWALVDNPHALYMRFAEHILLNCRGIEVTETIEAMQRAGEKITLPTIRRRLEQRGLYVPPTTVYISTMRGWLAKAGIFDRDAGWPRMYDVNHSRLEEVLGVGSDVIDSLTHLNKQQRDYLRALTRIMKDGPLNASKVAYLASTLYGAHYDRKNLPQTVLFPLRDLNYIQVHKTTGGRGAKPYEVKTTDKFHREITEPLIEAAAKNAGLVPKDMFIPLKEILEDMESSDTYVKGRALELLAIHLGWLIDLDFKGWRTRSADTGGAEVDAILEGARLIFSRWQVQAKNTPDQNVPLGDAAKEVGLALTFIYSNVVMMVTTGGFTEKAYQYVNHVLSRNNLNIILLNGAELKQVSQEPACIADILNRKAKLAMKVKHREDYFAEQ